MQNHGLDVHIEVLQLKRQKTPIGCSTDTLLTIFSSNDECVNAVVKLNTNICASCLKLQPIILGISVNFSHLLGCNRAGPAAHNVYPGPCI